MEEQKLMERMLDCALRDFALGDRGRAASRPGVVIIGDVTINGGLHLALPGSHQVNCGGKPKPL
jgi:hypothetical protein